MSFSHAMIDPANDADAAAPQAAAFGARADSPLRSLRFNAISRSLQRIFGEVVEQPLPERLRNMVEQVERAGEKRP